MGKEIVYGKDLKLTIIPMVDEMPEDQYSGMDDRIF